MLENTRSSRPEIPFVDLEDLRSTVPEANARAAAAIREAFGRYGLIYIRNHGLSGAEVDTWYDQFRAFTRRSTEEKQRLSTGHIWYQRGWTPPNTEKAVVAEGQPDFKECYFAAPMPSAPVMQEQYPEIYADNVWPDDVAGTGFDATRFRELYLSVGTKLHEVGVELLRGSALALDLARDTFTELLDGGPHVTRILHYLPLSAAQVNTGILWGEEHTDFNLLTMLPGGRFYDTDGKACARPDDKSGLFLRTRADEANPNGTLLRGRPPEGCIIAQVGQQLEILTGGVFLATPHVVTPPGVPDFSRMSSAHFIHVHSNRALAPLARFENAETNKSYGPPVLAGTYSLKTLVDIGLAPRAVLDRLGYHHYSRLGRIRASELESL